MKYVKISVLAAAVMLAACSGKNGDPGPKGDQGSAGTQGAAGTNGAQGTKGNDGNDAVIKAGALKGTITGKRYSDDRDIKESFNFAYAPSYYTGLNELYNISGGIKYASFYRGDSLGVNSVSLSVKLINEGASNETLVFDDRAYASGMAITFNKALSATQVLSIGAQSKAQAQSQYYPISKTENAKYNFTYDQSDYLIRDQDLTDPAKPYIFYTKDGKKVYFDPTVFTLIKVVNADNSATDKGVFQLYNKLKFNSAGQSKFVDATTDVSLAETIQVAGDVLTITNYKYDTTTGILTFDFTGTISANGRTNSTHNDLTITGSFNSGESVYKDIVGRKGN